MRKIIRIGSSVLALAIIACSKEEVPPPQKQTTAPPIETPVNKAPESFDLIDVADGSENVHVKPTFTWKAAIDPDGDKVSYDLYLDGDEDPATLYAENLSEPNFTVTDRLFVITDYSWKVIAKDAKGAEVTSTINSFTTRNLKLPENPITEDPGFLIRSFQTTVAFKDKLWLIGGSVPGGRSNEVWYSEDGLEWTDATPSLAARWFSPRFGHASVSFQGKLWVIGGHVGSGASAEVWFSEEGTSWTLATKEPGFEARYFHLAAVFDDKMWVIGGATDGNVKNDVWYSSDGVTWTEATANAAFSPRADSASTVFDNKLWVIGGGSYKNDVWHSTDGVQWTEATSAATFRGRVGHTVQVFDNKMWVIGGQNSDFAEKSQYSSQKIGFYSGIWFSIDGIRWNELQSEELGYLISHNSVAFKDKIYIIGGYMGFDEPNPEYNSIWILD